MKIAHYEQMMDYLTGPRERFGEGGITLNKKGPYKDFYAITLKRGGKNITFRDKDINVVKQKVKEFEATRPPTGGAAVKTKRKVEGISEKNLTRLREIITNKAKEKNLPLPNFEKFPGRGYPSNTPGNSMAKDLIRGIKKTGTRGGKDFKTVGTGTGSKALTDPLSKPEKELLEKTFIDVDFDFTKSRFGIDRKVNPELYRQAVNLVKENPKLVFGFQFMKPENYLLTTFQRARLQQLADTGVSEYVPIYKNQKIIGFQDNTEAGGGKKFYHADYKGGTSIKTHPNFEKVAKYVDIVKDTRGDHIPLLNKLFTDVGEKVPTFDQLLNNLLDSPGRGGAGSISAAIEKHHTKGVKTSTADLQLLTRDKNKLAALIEGRVDSGKMDFKTANRILKPEGIQIEREGVKIGAPDISPEKQVEDLKKFVTRKTLEKFAGNLDDPLAIRLATLGCPGKAMGGRIGFQTGATPTAQCITRGVNKINTGNIKSGADQRNFAKLLNTTGNLKNAVRVLSKIGVVGEGVWLGVETLGRSAIYGDTLSESFRKSADWLVPGNLTQDAQVDKINRVLKDKDLGAIYRKYDTYKDNLNKLKSLKASKEFDENILDDSSFSYTAVPEGRDAYLKRKEQEIEKQQNILDKSFVNPEQQLVARRAFKEAEDIAKSTALATRLKKFATDVGKQEDESGLNIDLDFIPRPEKIAPFGNFRDVASTKPEDLLKTYQDALRDGVYGNPGLESSVKKASEEYAEVRSGLENFKKMPLAELVQSGVASDEEVFGTQGANVLKKINQPVPFKRKSSYFQSPLELQEQNRLIEEGGMLGAAGGGLLKQAGDRSGKPPEAGPTPQGLDFLIKRGRQS